MARNKHDFQADFFASEAMKYADRARNATSRSEQVRAEREANSHQYHADRQRGLAAKERGDR